jgi:hypothetical protein
MAAKSGQRGQFKKGNPGKPFGAVNKINKTVKQTVLEVFNLLQDDPKHNLAQFAETYPRDFYAIAAKLIPTEVQGSLDLDLTIKSVEFE